MTDVADTEDDVDRDPDAENAEADAEGDHSTDVDQVDAEEAPDAPDGSDDPVEGDVTDELIARVAAVDVEAAAAVEDLRRRADAVGEALSEKEETLEDIASELESKEEAVDELESKLKRARADFQNYKKRTKQREETVRERATEDLVERLLDVRDNLVRALEQDDDVQVRDGVEATLATFDRVLAAENVSAIEPDPGADVEPERHEVVHRTESDHPEGVIASVYRPGYEMAGKVLRPAQVTVSEGDETGTRDDEGSAEAGDASGSGDEGTDTDSSESDLSSSG